MIAFMLEFIISVFQTLAFGCLYDVYNLLVRRYNPFSGIVCNLANSDDKDNSDCVRDFDEQSICAKHESSDVCREELSHCTSSCSSVGSSLKHGDNCVDSSPRKSIVEFGDCNHEIKANEEPTEFIARGSPAHSITSSPVLPSILPRRASLCTDDEINAEDSIQPRRGSIIKAKLKYSLSIEVKPSHTFAEACDPILQTDGMIDSKVNASRARVSFCDRPSHIVGDPILAHQRLNSINQVLPLDSLKCNSLHNLRAPRPLVRRTSVDTHDLDRGSLSKLTLRDRALVQNEPNVSSKNSNLVRRPSFEFCDESVDNTDNSLHEVITQHHNTQLSDCSPSLLRDSLNSVAANADIHFSLSDDLIAHNCAQKSLDSSMQHGHNATSDLLLRRTSSHAEGVSFEVTESCKSKVVALPTIQFKCKPSALQQVSLDYLKGSGLSSNSSLALQPDNRRPDDKSKVAYCSRMRCASDDLVSRFGHAGDTQSEKSHTTSASGSLTDDRQHVATIHHKSNEHSACINNNLLSNLAVASESLELEKNGIGDSKRAASSILRDDASREQHPLSQRISHRLRGRIFERSSRQKSKGRFSLA